MPTCPQCGLEVAEIVQVPAELKAKIKEVDPHFPLQNTICRNCIGALQRQAAAGKEGILMSQERARDEKKRKMWQARVALVKNGNALMKNNLYSEAAVAYEKYLRLLEMVFNCKPGELTPDTLKENAKTAELTVIAGVYWDLVRVYDASEKYGNRQRVAARQLARFAPLTPIYSDILKKSQVFMKTARHPEVIKQFLQASKAIRPRCFIATSAFDYPLAPEVTALRQFRDQKLKTNHFGRKFVLIYYRYSPKVACFLDRQQWLKPAIRAILRLLIKCVS